MKSLVFGAIAALLAIAPAHAQGWSSVHRYERPSGKCPGREVLASYYDSGYRTANGERFSANANTAAARDWPMGAVLLVTNPKTGLSVRVRINDLGPWGIAYRVGDRLDLARGAAHRIGMYGSQYVCVS